MNNNNLPTSNLFEYTEQNINDPNIYMLGHPYKQLIPNLFEYTEQNINDPNIYMIKPISMQSPILEPTLDYNAILKQYDEQRKEKRENRK
jgi:hypothetical protein